jgi:hypothetical protein
VGTATQELIDQPQLVHDPQGGRMQPYIALMPQWDFLDFLAEKASAYQEFTLIRNAEVKDLILMAIG